MRHFPSALLLVLACMAVGCPGRGPVPTSAPAPADPARVDAPGLPNVYRLTDRLYSGGSPDGDAGFASLQKLGIQTVISVDGARPDVERARKYGLRYAHLPIGYDGVPDEQALRIARAARDLPGPVYLHCHHGKHRGPAAAAVVRLCLDEGCTVEQAVAEMRRAGTDPRYAGLYAAPQTLRRPTPAELDRVPAEFPEVAAVAALAQVMVEIDERWDHLKQVRAAGWQAPANHPDLDPPHEALQLEEHYREASRRPEVGERSEEFRRWLTEAEEAAKELEGVLRPAPRDGDAVERAFRRAGEACSRCHAKYRDVPQGR
jgi:cytochrome c556/protein tyrosine phosphatase (PTP) superfamily phosphohydrolase (DUF442 family)